MSDFDKEAEREKLRQQYEKDKEARKSTQRMSELLLQGATMTGKHCDTCGDPIFRHDGTEFCPTCQHGGNAETTAESVSPEDSAEGTQPATEIEVEQTEAETEAGGEADEHSQSDQPTRTSQPPTPPRQPRRTPPSQAGESRGRGQETSHTESRPAERTRSDDAGDLSEARNALRRKLTRLAREAEETEDVGYARELLGATREAAEALAALERAKR
ncbi:Sjogren's syndrome/scleroderma autoantigen 1 family protein [Haladaptatus sp. NG-WS-4]